MTSKDLIVDHFTLARHHPIEDRLRIIAETGVRGIGLYLGDVQRVLAEGFTLDRLEELLTEYDLVLADLEAVRAFTRETAARAQVDGFLELAWQLADRFGARYLQAVGPAGPDRAAAAEQFADLCDDAAAHGMLVGLEPLPFTDLRIAAEVMEIVELAGRANGGLCLDIWHHTRGGEGRDALARIDPAKVFCVQMSDGPLAPLIDDYREDCLRTRVAPGSGEMDALGFARTLLALGIDVPWSLEVCNDSAWEAPGAEEHVRRCVESMRELLAAAGAPD